MLLLLAAFALQPPTVSPPIGQRSGSTERLILPIDAGDDPAIAAAASFPLGSARNPIRVGGPAGAQAYLARLRCSDGQSPQIGTAAERGPGAFGSIVSAVTLDCRAAGPATLLFDFYHAEHLEQNAPIGFTVAR